MESRLLIIPVPYKLINKNHIRTRGCVLSTMSSTAEQGAFQLRHNCLVSRAITVSSCFVLETEVYSILSCPRTHFKSLLPFHNNSQETSDKGLYKHCNSPPSCKVGVSNGRLSSSLCKKERTAG